MAATWRVAKDMMFQGNFKAPEVDMSGKTVVITGPSRGGIGFETALAIAQQGAQVLLAARNVEKATSDLEIIASHTGQAGKLKVFKCDVSSSESAHECAKEILKAHSTVDVLINNAGAVFEEEKTVGAGVEISFATCVLGHHVLNHKLKPRRIVWVTGDIYAISDGTANPFGSKVQASPLPMLVSSRLMLLEMKRRGVCQEIVAVHPGGMTRSQFIKGIKPEGCRTKVRCWRPMIGHESM